MDRTIPQATRSIAFVTRGCAKNEVDSDHMRLACINAGYAIAEDPEQADAIIVNTCSFIQAATEESIDAILDACNLVNVVEGGASVVVAGCMPARYGADLVSELPEVSAFVPCADESNIVEVLDGLFEIERGSEVPGHPSTARDNDAPISAYVKISDGCDRFCAYCAIPYIRGRYHSYSFEAILAEVEGLVENGTREIVLIAQDTGRWGQDFPEPLTLAWLVEQLAERFADTWFRIMYIQPEGVTEELLKVVRDHSNVCSYFDIPFQHANADILKSMNRHGSGSEYLKLIEKIRTFFDNVTLRTTLIAGFPGETDEQFEELCDFVEQADLDYVGVFAYSREEGTRAYNLPDQIDEDEKMRRAQDLRDLADSLSTARIANRIGKTMPVLVCGCEDDGQLYGRAMCQAPDVDGVVYIDDGEVGMVRDALIEDTLLYEMEGTCQGR